MAEIQLCVDMNRSAYPPQARGGIAEIGIGAIEVPPQQQSKIDIPLVSRMHRAYRVEPLPCRKAQAVERLHAFEERGLQLRRKADRSDALHVGVPTDRHQPRMLTTDHAARKCKIGDRQYVVDPMLVMCNAHRPHRYRILRLCEHAAGFADLFDGDSRIAGKIFQRFLTQFVENSLEAVGMRFDELTVERSQLDNHLQHALQQRDVAADAWHQIEVVDLRAEEERAGT